MIHLGYDFYEYGSIQKPNGLISQTINQSNRDTSIIFHLYLPPYITEMFARFGVKHRVGSPKNLEKLVLENQLGLVMLKIIEIIGEDNIADLDPETIYFLNRIMNKFNLKKIRNNILITSLPARV